MVAKNVIAPYVLNHYVWELLKHNTSMVAADYDGKTPIVMSGQEPEFSEFNKPFLVYGFSEDSTPDLYAVRSGSLSYAVYSTIGGEVTTILNVIRGGMERRDDTAKEINAYSSTISQFLGIRFGSVTIGYFEGPGPEETEGGRKAGIITLRYDYFMDIPVVKFNPYTNAWA